MSVLSSLPVPDLLDGTTPVVSREEASHIAVLRNTKNVGSGGGATAPIESEITSGVAEGAPLAGSNAIAAVAAAAAAGDANDDGEPYYWENVTGAAPITPPLPVVLVHHVHYFFSRAWSTAEYLGDFFSELFGLYNSRYEWAVELERRNIEQAEEAELLEERKKRWAEMKAAGVKPSVVVQSQALNVAEANALLAKDEEDEVVAVDSGAGTGV